MTESKQHDSHRSGQGVRLTLEIGRPWLVTLWAVFIFLTGAVTGAALLHLWHPRPPRHERQESPLPRDFARRMQRDLELSDEQARAVEEIVARYEPRFRQTSEQAREQLRADLEAMQQEILPILDERQRALHQDKWRHMLRPPKHHKGPPHFKPHKEGRPPKPWKEGRR